MTPDAKDSEIKHSIIKLRMPRYLTSFRIPSLKAVFAQHSLDHPLLLDNFALDLRCFGGLGLVSRLEGRAAKANVVLHAAA